MANTDYKGMFEKIGIDTRTQEQVLAQRASRSRQKNEEELAATAGRYPGDLALQRAGRQIGTHLNNKYGDGQTLDPKEQANVDAIAAAQARFEEAKADGRYTNENGTPNLVLESEAFNNAIAAELIKIGDPRGMELALATDEARTKREADEQTRVEKGLDIESKGRKAVEEEYDAARKRWKDIRGTFTMVYPQGETNPNEGMSAFIDDNGDAHSRSGVILKLGDYTDKRPIEPKVGKNGAPAAIDIKDYISLKNLGAMQSQHRGLVGQMNMAVAMRDALVDGLAEDGSLEIMGTGGKITSGVSNFVNNLSALSRSIGEALQIEDSKGKLTTFTGTEGAAAKYARDHQELFEGMALPPSIVGKSNAIARYQAIIVQFAYGKARLNENGSRISDSDFNNAIRQIGANATNPEALRQILVGDLTRAVANFDQWDKTFPQEVRPLLINRDARKMYDAAFENFNTAFDQDFGTPNRVGPGLTNPQGDRKTGDSVTNSGGALTSPALSQLELELAKLQESNAARRAALEEAQ